MTISTGSPTPRSSSTSEPAVSFSTSRMGSLARPRTTEIGSSKSTIWSNRVDGFGSSAGRSTTACSSRMRAANAGCSATRMGERSPPGFTSQAGSTQPKSATVGDRSSMASLHTSLGVRPVLRMWAAPSKDCRSNSRYRVSRPAASSAALSLRAVQVSSGVPIHTVPTPSRSNTWPCQSIEFPESNALPAALSWMASIFTAAPTNISTDFSNSGPQASRKACVAFCLSSGIRFPPLTGVFFRCCFVPFQLHHARIPKVGQSDGHPPIHEQHFAPTEQRLFHIDVDVLSRGPRQLNQTPDFEIQQLGVGQRRLVQLRANCEFDVGDALNLLQKGVLLV